ncbi:MULTISPECIES: hypothetical protein [Mycobacterium avium complex (MAC)]|uniref:hypothetical protein n=1 Tax=Mycobacterium avium complex (MAC) TaxID=120793 RepID=UPI00191588A1|nr:hypothetical protein [Mycobacterium paraintracellulare]BCP08103.1 hypothetical protein MINTM020_02010 [Mycobacterium paraintracellulare]
MDANDRIPHDDWVDQDLLTRDEAASRLVTEIAEVAAKIEAGEGDELAERRLAGMREALEHYRRR